MWRILRRIELRRFAWLPTSAAVAALCACASGGGRPAAEGSVVDATTGAPIAAAVVVEWIHERPWLPGDGAKKILCSRVATTNREGRFVMPEAPACSGRFLRRPLAPSVAVAHAEYGLHHQRSGSWELSADRARAPMALQDLVVLCRRIATGYADPGSLRLRDGVCRDVTPRPR